MMSSTHLQTHRIQLKANGERFSLPYFVLGEREDTMKFEITMNGQPYAFNFGMGFLKAINAKATDKVPDSNYSINTGAKYIMAQVMDKDVEALCEVLMLANKGEQPRLTEKVLYSYIEDEDTDIEKVFDTVLDFFGKANATKMVYQSLKALTEAIQ